MNPRNRNRIRRRERSLPPPQARDPRQPRRFPGTRRPVSSEAPGESGEAACGTQMQSRRPGLPPLRRPPFPSVSSSSSSFVSRGFPLVPVASVSVPVFGSRAGLSGPLFRPFDRVQVSENRAAPELSFRLRSRGCRAFSPARLSVSLAFASLMLGFNLVSGLAVRFAFASLPFGPVQLQTAFRRRRLRSRSTSRSRPPVPLVCCLFRSWFVSRSFVWFVWFRPFGSAQFRSTCLVCPLDCPSCSVLFIFSSFRFGFAGFVLSLIFVFACSRTGLFNIFLAYIIHLVGRKQNVFFIEKHVFFKNNINFLCKT